MQFQDILKELEKEHGIFGIFMYMKFLYPNFVCDNAIYL